MAGCVWVLWSIFGCLIVSTGYGSSLILNNIDVLTKVVVTQLRESAGVTYASLAGREGGVAGRYTKM
jgi:hypothetical protein